jgi:hypothetical protein
MRSGWWTIRLMLMIPLGACGYSASEQEKSTVGEMTTEMQAWAIGRHLVELPSTWTYGMGSEVTLYYGLGSDFETVDVTIVAESASKDLFQDALTSRIALIGKATHSLTQSSMLNVHSQVAENTTLLRYFKHKQLEDTRTHEIHLLLNDIYVLIQADSYDNRIASVESRLKQLATQIHKVVIPERVGPGFVLGPIIIRSHHDHERGTIYFHDSQRRDVTLEVDVSAVTPDEDMKLAQRVRRDMEGFGVPSSAYLRDRKISLAGMEGEEVLLGYDARSSAEEETHRELLFSAESYRPSPGFMWPMLSFRLTTGGQKRRPPMPVRPEFLATRAIPSFARTSGVSTRGEADEDKNSSLTTCEAIGVWDAILKTVSPRPGAVARPPQPVSNMFTDPIKIAEQMRIMNAWLEERPPSSGPRRPDQS